MVEPRHTWKFPPDLSSRHIEELKKRAISRDFALASAIRTIADNEAREIGFSASIPAEELKNGLQGICFPYRDIHSGVELSYRIKPDRLFSLNGDSRKYLGLKGDHLRAYYPHTTTEAQAANPKVNLIITEGEYKALALAEQIVPITSRLTCVIGIQGVNGGWRRDKMTVILPTGEKDVRKEGHPHLIDDLDEWEWKKRVVYIVFDSDVGSRKNAAEFKKSTRAGAWGAEYTLALLLKARGAEVRIVVIPPLINGDKCGIDDFMAERGNHEAIKLIYNNWTAERDADKAIYEEKRAGIKFESMRELARSIIPKPAEVIKSILPAGCVAAIGGPAGAGKSLLALNAAHAVSTGGKFLDFLSTKEGKVLYIQTEMPRWMLKDRVENISEISDNFLGWSPGSSMPLNWWEPDGFNKKRETGNRDAVMALIDQIRTHGFRMVIFDPLKDFTSISLSDPEAAKHTMQIFRTIARTCQCGILLIHHHKKTGGREGKYEGHDDMFGSYIITAELDSAIGLYPQTRADGTSRYKMIFSKLRHAPPMLPMEIDRMTGGDPSGWRAVPWEDHGTTLSSDDRVLQAIQHGPCDYKSISKATGISKSQVYDITARLEKRRLIEKNGSLYYANDKEEKY